MYLSQIFSNGAHILRKPISVIYLTKDQIAYPFRVNAPNSDPIGVRMPFCPPIQRFKVKACIYNNV